MTEHPESLTNIIASRADMKLESFSKDVRMLWAKSGDEMGSLSLVQHMADSAVVAAWLWDTWVADALKYNLSRLTGLNSSEVGKLYVFLASVHDIGKATVDFQTLVLDRPQFSYLVDNLREAGIEIDELLPRVQEQRFVHGILSGEILRAWSKSHGLLSSRAAALGDIVDAHHGRSSDPQLFKPARQRLKRHSAQWHSFHQELLDAFADVAEVSDVLPKLAAVGPLTGPPQMLLAGLIVMADWIASNADAFGYAVEAGLEIRLRQGIQSLDLTAPWRFRELPEDVSGYFREAFGWPQDFAVRPVQRAAAQVAHKIGDSQLPSIVVIEAPTGEGKTEAGLAIAEIVGKAIGAQGAFLAAPTMSTSNGLFDRASAWAANSSEDGAVASLYLAHSKNRLLENFDRLRFRGIGSEHGGGSVVASQWLSGRKKGVLANFVVGTVDQVLMMSLQMRHLMLRHVGLAGKVVIIDEAHAYDVYMSSYLQQTLRWLARYGVTVILMSATLPPAQRKALVEAYAGEVVELGEMHELDASHGYPLITVANANGMQFVEVEQRPVDLVATIEVIDDSLEVLGKLVSEVVSDGGVVLIICNTVKRAQDAFGFLNELFPETVELHHAAFIAAERAVREETLRRELGPTSHRGAGRPELKVVVATQVAEQSLDIDADLLISDIAPMDSLIQRAGRLHRHQRPASDRPGALADPRILVRGVLRSAPVPEFDGGAAAIYDPMVLLATFARFPKSFARPIDVEPLVRTTYELVERKEEAVNEVALEWADAWLTAVAKSEEKQQSAVSRSRTFQVPEPRRAGHIENLFVMLSADEEEKANAQVRDAESTVEVIVLEGTEYGYRPFGIHKTPVSDLGDVDYQSAKELAAHSVRLPARMTRRNSDFDAVIEDAVNQTPTAWMKHPLLKGLIAVQLDHAGEGTLGRFKLRYSQRLGLEVEAMT